MVKIKEAMEQQRYVHSTKSYDYITVPFANASIPLEHCIQQSDWDCGIACLEMVLPRDKLQYFLSHRQLLIDKQSIDYRVWTIDLAYMLTDLNVSYKFCTSVAGVSPTHYGNKYYNSVLHQDEDRVNLKFQQAEKNGVIVCKDILCSIKLVHHLSDFGPIIALTDSNYLSCDKCNENRHNQNLNESSFLPYQGHYIVLSGYCLASNHILYKNPSQDHDTCTMPLVQLDKARHASGTDDDIILIYSNYNTQHQSLNHLKYKLCYNRDM